MSPRGFILLPVVFAITLIAALAFLLSRGGPMALELGSGDARGRLADAVAEAGMQHALWRANASNCSGYALPNTPFGAHKYSASYSASSGSPVDITVTAGLADGTTRTLTRRSVAIQQAPVSVDLEPTADTFIDENHPTDLKGTDNSFFVQTDTAGQQRRTALRFDLTGIPYGARILSARLSLMLKGTNGSPVPIAVRRVTQSWKEVEASWSARLTSINWTAPGGDIDRAQLSTASVGPTKDIRYAWDLTSMVGGWVAGAYANNGLILVGADSNAKEEFYSREESNTARHPRLSVTYACDCGTVCVAPKGTGKILFVVSDKTALTASENYKKSMFESWGYTVSLIADEASANAYSTDMSNNDVAYVSESVDPATLGTKLTAITKGVVWEDGGLNSVFSVASGYGQAMGSSLAIVDNSHEITHPFATGPFKIYSAAMEGLTATGTLAAGSNVLARWGSAAGLVAVAKGAALAGGGTAADRRVMLPLGREGKFNPAYLTNDGRLLVQRALAWARGTVVDPLTLGLVAHWMLDDATGSTALDSVGGHHGTLTNGPTWATGQLAGAASFDGNDDFVDVPDDPGLALTQGMTISALIKATAFGTGSGYQPILTKEDNANSNYWFGTNNRDIAFGLWVAGAWRPITTTGLNLQTDTWYLLTASFDSSSDVVVFYLNGQRVQTSPFTYNPSVVSASLKIGQDKMGSNWPGLLDDVRLYNRVLSEGEIGQLAQAADICGGSFEDRFNSISYAGSNGSLPWATDWQEVNETDGATGGDEIVKKDISNFQLRVQDNGGGLGEGVMRTANLSGYTLATLSFDYRRQSLDNSNDWVAVQVSKDGGPWVELGRFAGPGSDSVYQSASYDISAHMGAYTSIRFISSPTLGTNDIVWFDNVKIAVSGCAP